VKGVFRNSETLIKRPNLRIMGIEGEERFIIYSLKKALPIQVQEASRTPNRLDQNRNSPGHIIIKTTNTENRERILKAIREKKQRTYKGKPIKITTAFSTETLKEIRTWSVFQELNENNFKPRILYPAKLSFKIDGAIKIFHNK
jgi:hypothetical protein